MKLRKKQQEDYDEFRIFIARTVSPYSPIFKESEDIEQFPYSFSYKFKLSHDKPDWVFNPFKPEYVEYTRDFIYDTIVSFQFYYMVSAIDLSSKFYMRISIFRFEERTNIFLYENLDLFKKDFTEIIDIFKNNFKAKSIKDIDMVIGNFENYCALAKLE